jgi:1-acyl-sn-glycerol-3-phosphate acyltransferase
MTDLYGVGSRTVHRVLRIPNRFAAQAYFDLSVTGKDNIPKTGPAVIAANHFSHLDPPLIISNLDRYTRFLAVDDLYGKSRVFDLALDFFQAIPLDRDGYPVRAMRQSIDHLDGGNIVGLFPEGRRVESWGENQPKRGAAWLAWMTGAPLIPIAVHGTRYSLSPGEQGFHRTAVHIWIDEPLWWHDYLDSVDPLGDMMQDWYTVVDGYLEPWAAER